VKSQIPQQYLNPPTSTPTSAATAPGVATNLRLNEVLALNHSALAINAETPDYIELFNAGASAVQLSDYSLTDNASSPRKFVFPAGTVIGPGAYLTVLADNGTAANYLHAGFSLRGEGESVYLYDSLAHGGGQLDTVAFGIQIPDYSVGRQANGDWTLTQPTPNLLNSPVALGDVREVAINEWMASEQVTVDSDFIELYNADSLPVALGGMYLSDKPNSLPELHQIAPLSFIAGNGFVVLQADGNVSQGADHLGFKLTADQEMFALFGQNDVEVDRVLVNWQADDVSHGRSPNGQSTYGYFTFPTPGLANATTTSVCETLVDYSATWSFNDSGQNLGTAWRSLSYNDSSWSTGTGAFGYENSTIPVAIHTPMADGVMAYYLRHKFNLASAPADASYSMTVEVDDGAVVYVNGVEAHRLGMPGGTINSTTPANRTVGNADLESFVLPSSLFHTGTNVIAVEVHQADLGSSDVVFAGRLDRTTTNTSSDYGNAEAIFNSLRVTEVMYHPVNADLEYVRLENIGDASIELAGVKLTGGVSFEFSAQTLSPGESLAVVADAAQFRSAYGDSFPVAGEYSGKLNNAGDDLALALPSPHQMNGMNFHFQEWWHPATDGMGSALRIVSPDAPAASWNQRESWSAAMPNFSGAVRGDLNADAVVNLADVLEMTAALRAGSTSGVFDLDHNGVVETADLHELIMSELHTLPGDANLDGRVDGVDFGTWQANRFQAGTDWTTADFNGDGLTDVIDFNIWNQYKFQQPAAVAADAGNTLPRSALSAHRIDQVMALPVETQGQPLSTVAAPTVQARLSLLSTSDAPRTDAATDVQKLLPQRTQGMRRFSRGHAARPVHSADYGRPTTNGHVQPFANQDPLDVSDGN
ncbi:MAG: lamin tail domain-containing protein, partial [Planctomycetales bacterium]|nr:lamin tail domain-containing protein [Planctomycetales bacterium]